MSIAIHSKSGPVQSEASIALSTAELDITKSAITSYYGICDKYAEWVDPLTKLVKSVGEKFFGGKLSTAGALAANPATVEKFAQQLTHELLIDDLYRQPLQKPKLDRSWTWEGRDIKHYKALFGDDVPKSPFDLLPIVEQTHEFAKEMLDWAKVYSKPTMPSSLTSTSTILAPLSTGALLKRERDGRLSYQTREPSSDPSANALMVIFYCNLARTSRETQELIETRRGAEMETKLLAAIRVESTRSRLTFEAEAERSDAVHHQEMETGLRDIESRNKASQDELRKKAESYEADLKFTKAELERGKIRLSQQQNTIYMLSQSIAQIPR